MNDPIPIRETDSDPQEIPPPPAKLGAVGVEVWNDLVERFEFRVDELLTLGTLCRLFDDEARLTKALAKAPVQVRGSMGQMKPNPLFAEVRQTRLALTRTLDSLALGDAASDGQAKSHAGRRLARMRWG